MQMKPITYSDPRLTLNQNKIIELMLNAPDASREDIADEMCMSAALVTRELRKARNAGADVPEFQTRPKHIVVKLAMAR